MNIMKLRKILHPDIFYQQTKEIKPSKPLG